jgi:hypothetical protein
MLPLLADEHIDGSLLAGVLQRHPEIEFIRVQDYGLRQAPDPVILEWITQNRFVFVTHDAKSMPRHVDERLQRGVATAGVFIVPRWLSMGKVIDDLILIGLATDYEEWENRVVYLPLRGQS